MSNNKKENKEALESIRNTGYWLAQTIYKNFPAEFKSSEDLTKKFGWKMLNYITSNNKERFIEYLYRLYWSYKVKQDKGIFTILNTTTNDFKKYALAFINGFISDPKKESKSKEENNE